MMGCKSYNRPRRTYIYLGCLFVCVALFKTASAESVLFKGGTLVNADQEPFKADIRVSNGTIIEIGELAPVAGDEVIDVGGRLLMPGGIDPHVHIVGNPTGETMVDDYQAASQAAFAGGITTVGQMAFPAGEERLAEVIKREEAFINTDSGVDVFLHLGVFYAARGVSELSDVVAAGQRSIKVFMPFDFFDTAYPDYLELFAAAQQLGITATVHAEDYGVIEYHTRRLEQQGSTDIRFYPESRPASAEHIATDRAISMARETGVTLYLVHITTGGVVDRAQRSEMDHVFLETRPLYLNYDISQWREENRGIYLGMPPLRSRSDQEQLWAALLDGRIQTLGSDHAPWSLARKLDDSQTIRRFNAGMSNLQVMLPMLFSEGVHNRGMELQRFVAVSSTNSAKIFGLFPRKGFLGVGSDADIVVWNPERTKVIHDSDMYSKSGFSIYGGWEVKGWPELTMRRGEIVAQGRDVQYSSRGQLLRSHVFDP